MGHKPWVVTHSLLQKNYTISLLYARFHKYVSVLRSVESMLNKHIPPNKHILSHTHIEQAGSVPYSVLCSVHQGSHIYWFFHRNTDFFLQIFPKKRILTMFYGFFLKTYVVFIHLNNLKIDMRSCFLITARKLQLRKNH